MEKNKGTKDRNLKMPWYKKGLHFKCLGCAGCCKGFPGYVWITQEEILKIAEFLKLSKDQFLKKYTRQVDGNLSLKEMIAPTYECIFLKNNKCEIYSVRPFQCSSYPFWTQNLSSKKAWIQNVEKHCPGSHEKKGLLSFEEIQSFGKF